MRCAWLRARVALASLAAAAVVALIGARPSSAQGNRESVFQTIYKNKVWEPWGCPSGWSNPKDVKGAMYVLELVVHKYELKVRSTAGAHRGATLAAVLRPRAPGRAERTPRRISAPSASGGAPAVRGGAPSAPRVRRARRRAAWLAVPRRGRARCEARPAPRQRRGASRQCHDAPTPASRWLCCA